MVREELEEASRAIEEAIEAAAEDVREQLQEQADQLSHLAEREGGPDHGRLARHQQAIRGIKDDVDERVHEYLDRANERIEAYRETIEGV